MKRPKLKVRVQHSQSKPAWNIVGTELGGRYKIARIPYVKLNEGKELEAEMTEALERAEFIAWCLNNAQNLILKP